MGVERVDYSSDDEFRQAQEEEMRQQTSWDSEYGLADYQTTPCCICGRETILLSRADPEKNMCMWCEPLTGAEKVIKINERMNKEKFKNTP